MHLPIWEEHTAMAMAMAQKNNKHLSQKMDIIKYSDNDV